MQSALMGMNLYERLILRHPKVAILLFLLTVAGIGHFAKDFRLDATSESLTLEHDAALDYYRQIRETYGSDDFLIVAYTPDESMFSSAALARIAELRDGLEALVAVESVLSILDVPLVASPLVDLRSLPDGLRYLSESETDIGLAREEFLTSPLYRDNILSSDGRTTALRVNLQRSPSWDDLSRQAQLQSAGQAIADVRAVLEEFRQDGSVYLGGVPMIIADSIDFIEHDLIVFGIAVLVFLVAILGAAFHKLRWILLPLITCLGTCVVMLGLLGWLDRPVTVVSSNFLSLLLILCLALTLHIIVRYREAHTLFPAESQLFLVRRTVRFIVVPCFYTALTTIVAFGSLLVSGIRPVIDFGWMMVAGVALAFIFSFTFFPAALMLFRPGEPRRQFDSTAAVTAAFARIVDRHHRFVIGVSLVIVVASIVGMTRLTVENRFIDYYRESTEIYQGMELIDRQLGGTTPLDVIIDAPASWFETSESTTDTADDDDFDDIYAEDEESEAGITATSYWFNSRKLPEVGQIHDYLDALPQTGKVISIATVARMLEAIEPTLLEDNIELSIVYRKLPNDVRQTLINPYLSPDANQLRFSIRVFESDRGLRRGELLQTIEQDLAATYDIGPERLNLSGMLVLYNNMLESLFRSQILTLGAVFLAILLMFMVLFRSLRVAATAILPNIASAVLVLGLMGFLGIPLDLMTITIAAITVGIAVDDTIHYVHRYRHEYAIDGDPWASVKRCHGTIGRAMYYTSVTIMLGFSVLALSQFVPTVYFGLLTGFAMLVALLANMTLLPALLVVFKAR